MMKLIHSCFRAFKLLLIFYGSGAVVFACYGWIAIVGSILAALSRQWEAFALFSLLSLAALLASSLLMGLGNGIYRLLLKLLWTQLPKWSRIVYSHPDFWLSWGIGAIASAPLAIFVAAARGETAMISQGDRVREVSIASLHIVQYFWLWLFITASLFLLINPSRVDRQNPARDNKRNPYNKKRIL